jgi:hypothetical protein
LCVFLLHPALLQRYQRTEKPELLTVLTQRIYWLRQVCCHPQLGALGIGAASGTGEKELLTLDQVPQPEME